MPKQNQGLEAITTKLRFQNLNNNSHLLYCICMLCLPISFVQYLLKKHVSFTLVLENLRFDLICQNKIAITTKLRFKNLK